MSVKFKFFNLQLFTKIMRMEIMTLIMEKVTLVTTMKGPKITLATMVAVTMEITIATEHITREIITITAETTLITRVWIQLA